MKTKVKRPVSKPVGFPKRLKEGNAEITIYHQSNPSRVRNPETGAWEHTGKVFDEYVLAYYQGTRQVTDRKTGQPKTLPKFIGRKFGNLADAEREATFILTKLANAEGEVLKRTGLDRAAYVHAMQKLREWRPDAVTGYMTAAKRLPENVTLQKRPRPPASDSSGMTPASVCL